MKRAKNKKHLGGMKMKKIKLLTAILFCLSIAGVVSAREVISIDLNAYGNTTAYSGKGAVDSNFAQVWRAYYGGNGYGAGGTGGWGKAMGSPRAYHLADYNEPNKPSIYAAQVWISDMNASDANIPAHGWYGSISETNLMGDGFYKNGSLDPCIRLWGRGAYGGRGGIADPNFDIYVYGPEAGDFTLTVRGEAGYTAGPNHITGIVPVGQDFNEGGNYVVYRNVPIHYTDPCDPCDPNNFGYNYGYVTISYSNKLSGLQLVKLRDPLKINRHVTENLIRATAYDVAYETNRLSAENDRYGVDYNALCLPNGCQGVPEDLNHPCGLVVATDRREEIGYDIDVNSDAVGTYILDVNVTDRNRAGNGNLVSLDMFIDDANVGTTVYDAGYFVWPPRYTLNPLSVKLFKGIHTIMWRAGSVGYIPQWGFNVHDIRLKYDSPATMVNCDEVYEYGYNYVRDYAGAETGPYDVGHDCRVNFNDLAVITDNWLNCYSPDPGVCP
jgi:hypothetical protein